MSGVLDLFLAQPFGARSLLQRIFGMAINDGVNSVQKTIDTLGSTRIKDDVLCDKIKAYVQADEGVKEAIRQEAARDNVDVVVTILRSEFFQPELSLQQVEKVFNAYVAWNNAVENVRSRRLSRTASSRSNVSTATNATGQVEKEMRSGAELFAHLKQYLKLCLRQRDKLMMLQIIEEVSWKGERYLERMTDVSLAHDSPTLPRSIHHFLRAACPCLQVRERIQQHYRFCHVRR